MRIRSIALQILALAACFVSPALAAEQRLPGAMVIDAAAFVDHLPKGQSVTTAHRPELPWLFNNFGITLNNKSELSTSMQVPAEGNYHLFVRSQGTAQSGFKVSVNGQSTEPTLGRGAQSFVDAGEFYLNKTIVEVRITSITPGSTFDLIVLTPESELKEADVWSLQYPAEIVMHKDYKIPPASSIKFGDLNGDGDMDFVVFTPNYSAYAYKFDGTELWHWDAPAAGAQDRAETEAPGTIWDFDQNGKADVVHWRMIDGKEYLCLADGMTGEVKYKVEWPTSPLPHAYSNFRTAVATLHAGYPDGLIVYSDTGTHQTISAFGPKLNQLWTHEESREKDYFGHKIYPVDLNGDAISEIYLSHLCLDAFGKTIWSDVNKDSSNDEPIHSARFADLNGDGGFELIAAQGKSGVNVYPTGAAAPIWKASADDVRQVEVGSFLSDAPSPQVVAASTSPIQRANGMAEIQSQIRWYGPNGRAAHIWPENPLNISSIFVKGDWYGNNKPQLFWGRFHLESDGTGTLFFPEEAYQMFDFVGNGSEQVICVDKAAGIMRIYGSRDAKGRDALRDTEYLQNIVANHVSF